MVIVDTSVWIEYLRGHNHAETAWLDRELQKQALGLTDLILCEVLQGTRDSAFARVQADLLRLHIFRNCSTQLAIAAAQNYRTLRRNGYTVRTTIDCLIATFCLENNHSLLHRDHDFDAFEVVLGLRIIHP
jgi:predicted nucleic acid-binding protein